MHFEGSSQKGKLTHFLFATNQANRGYESCPVGVVRFDNGIKEVFGKSSGHSHLVPLSKYLKMRAVRMFL